MVTLEDLLKAKYYPMKVPPDIADCGCKVAKYIHDESKALKIEVDWCKTHEPK